MDITELSLSELKAIGYDLYIQHEELIKNRTLVHQEITKRQQVTTTPQIEETENDSNAA